MGILSWLRPVADVVGAPFTGGASLLDLIGSVPSALQSGGSGTKAVPGVSDVLGGAASAAQKQKNTEDSLKLALAGDQLNRQKFAVAAPAARMNTGSGAALSAALAKAGPTSIQWGGPGSGLKGQIPTTSGGFHDAISSVKDNPDYMSLLDLVGKDSLAGEKAGGATGGNGDITQPSVLSDVGKSTAFDKVLGGAGMGTSILGALGKSGIFDKPSPLISHNVLQPSTDTPAGGSGIDLSSIFGNGEEDPKQWDPTWSMD